MGIFDVVKWLAPQVLRRRSSYVFGVLGRLRRSAASANVAGPPVVPSHSIHLYIQNINTYI